MYITLGDDLDTLIGMYDTNPLVTENQRKRWYQQGRRRAITHKSFGKDGSNPLFLLQEDGFDGDPIGVQPESTVRKYWDYNDWHIFVPPQVLVRFGVFMHLDIYSLTALVLKGDWEIYFAQDVHDYHAGQKDNLNDILLNAPDREIQEAEQNFNPDTTTIYGLLEEHNKLTSQSGYDKNTFDALVQKMIMEDLHLCGIDSNELVIFAENEKLQLQLLKNGTPQQQQEYWICRCSHIELLNERDRHAMRVENLRLKNAETIRQWDAEVRPFELDLEEQSLRYDYAERILLLKHTKPEQSKNQLEKLLEKEKALQDRRALLDEIRLKVASAHRPKLVNTQGMPIADDMLVERKKKCKKILAKIRMLTHPDKLMHHPSYENLTETNKQQLQKILQDTFNIEDDELGIPTGYVGHDTRSVEGLQRVLNKAKAILENSGIEINPDLSTQGETLLEQIKWIESEIAFLESDIALCKSQLLALDSDAEMKQKRELLENIEQLKQLTLEIKKRADELRKQADECEKELEALFQKETKS